jgi:PEP-CTERM motif
MRNSLFWSLMVVATIADGAWAHGPQIQVTGEGAKIVTRSLILDGPYSDSLTDVKTVYVMPVRENVGEWYSRPNGEIDPALHVPAFFSGPGIAYGYGFDPSQPGSAAFFPGSIFSLDFTAGLLRWDGAAFVDPGLVQVEAFRGSIGRPTATARTSDAGPFASLHLGTVNYGADGDEVHVTSRFRLLGDGVSPAVESPDGVYLLRLQLNNTRTAASDPFYFVLNKNQSRNTVDAAVAWLNVAAPLVQFVPEPGAAGLAILGLAAAALAARRRRSIWN